MKNLLTFFIVLNAFHLQSATGGKGTSAFGGRHHIYSKKQPAIQVATKETKESCYDEPYTEMTKGFKTETRSEPYDCSSTITRAVCKDIDYTVEKWCTKTNFNVESYDCSETVTKFVCEDQPIQQWHGKKLRRLGVDYHNKKGPQVHRTCREQPEIRQKTCTRTVPKDSSYRCDEIAKKTECQDVTETIEKICAKAVQVQVPYTLPITKTRRKCQTVKSPPLMVRKQVMPQHEAIPAYTLHAKAATSPSQIWRASPPTIKSQKMGNFVY